MEEALRLTQKQKLQQTLSPLQVQFVRLLEMNGHEIEQEVDRELAENPALEIAPEAAPEETDTAGDFDESAEQLQLADYRSEEDIPDYRYEAHNASADDRYYEPTAVAGEGSLMDQLMSQLSQLPLSDKEMQLARIITGNIDDNGYLTRTVPQIIDDAAIHDGIDADAEEVRKVLAIVRSLEPAGVGAVDLRDCLLLQLKARKETDDVMLAKEIVEHNFDIFSRMDFDRLGRAVKAAPERLRKAVDVIRSLNPKPGSAFQPQSVDEDKMRQITPDFLVESDGVSLSLTLLNRLPALQIETTFADADVEVTPRTPRRKAEAMEFIRRRRDDAASFIRLMSMRQETLYRVMTAIMKLQRDFFLTDDELALKPMILKDVAELTGYDISVVSRAASGKYVATRRGVYPLKFFFNERPMEDSDASSREIVAALREIIDSENKSAPLSDEALASELRSRGYDIARRTVAKYREKEQIPVARLRRQVL